eukprot:SAG31_NODE_2029_length_6629_cov_2.348698_3_plen_305_part_00
MATAYSVADTSDGIYKTADGNINYLHGTKEETNFRELRAIIMQTASLASHATAIFKEIHRDIAAVAERTSLLHQRLDANIYNGHLPYIEHKFVVQDEPMTYFDNAPTLVHEIRGEWSERADNFFTTQTLPAGVAEQCSQMRTYPDFDSVDKLSSGYGTDEFTSAQLRFSNPNTFVEQQIQELQEKKKKDREERKAHRARRKAERSKPDAIANKKEKARVKVVKKKKRKDMIGVDVEDAVVIAFKKIDTNGDGSLSADELMAVSVAAGEPMTTEQIAEAMKRMDVDGDGKVCYSRPPCSAAGHCS